MSALAVVIRIELERPLSICTDALNEGEQARLLDWVNAHPELAEIVSLALALHKQESAA